MSLRVCAALLCFALSLPVAAEAVALSCPEAGLALEGAALPHLRASLRDRHPFSVLAIGAEPLLSPGVFGGALNPLSLPAQIADGLIQSRPSLRIDMAVLDGQGLSAAQQLPLLRAELRHGGHHQLILWQTGTIDAASGISPGDFSQTLAMGAELAARNGATLILIEPQYSRFLEAATDISPYLDAMRLAATNNGAAVFHRYAIMRGWAESGALDLEQASPETRAAESHRLRACLGLALAQALAP
jgi:hypothetical protein